jgi:hypothetical protein
MAKIDSRAIKKMADGGIEPPTPNTPLSKSYFPRAKDIKNILDH